MALVAQIAATELAAKHTSHRLPSGWLPQPPSHTHKPAGLQTPRKLQAAQLPAVSQSADGVHSARAMPPSSTVATNNAANSRACRCRGRRGTAWRCASALPRRVRTIIMQRRAPGAVGTTGWFTAVKI
jgi:hypothetical protein